MTSPAFAPQPTYPTSPQDQRSARVPIQAHGMDMFLTRDLLHYASNAMLMRLATWLDVLPSGPWESTEDEAYALRAAIMRAEQRLAEGPRHLRWVRQLPKPNKVAATWPLYLIR